MQAIKDWQSFNGIYNEMPEGVSLIYIGAASAVIFSLIAQLGEQVDYLRFLPEKTPKNNFREFKRAHLHDINPVGLGSMLLSCLLGIICYSHLLGDNLKALSHFITFFSCFLFAPFIAYITQGKYYIAREADKMIAAKSVHQCCICENDYMVIYFGAREPRRR